MRLGSCRQRASCHSSCQAGVLPGWQGAAGLGHPGLQGSWVCWLLQRWLLMEACQGVTEALGRAPLVARAPSVADSPCLMCYFC